MPASGVCWVSASGLFTALHAPMLIPPRLDGKSAWRPTPPGSVDLQVDTDFPRIKTSIEMSTAAQQ
jgi:hypothetical protein